jgi:hypothetical protein
VSDARTTQERCAGGPGGRAVVFAIGLATALGCSDVKKHAVTKQDFALVNDYVLKKLNFGAHSPAERKQYIVSQLGGPHRTGGDMAYWYTPVADCYYFQMSAEGWGSWGTGATEDCKRWAVVGP